MNVSLPLGIISLIRLVLRVPRAEEGLVCEIQRGVNGACWIAIKRDALLVSRIDTVQALSIDLNVFCVHQILVIARLSVHVGPKLLELRLCVGVDYVHHVRAVVEVLVPVDADFITGHIGPSILVLLGQLRAFLDLFQRDAAHGAGGQGPCNYEYDTHAEEAYGADQ